MAAIRGRGSYGALVSIVSLSVLVLCGCTSDPQPPPTPVAEKPDEEPAAAEVAEETPEPPSVLFVRRHGDVAFQYAGDDIRVVPRQDGFEVLKEGGPDTVQALIGPRLEGDFEVAMALGLPPRSDPRIDRGGGTSLPYFGFRSADGQKESYCHAPFLAAEAETRRFVIRRREGVVSATLDGEPKTVYGESNDSAGYVFVHLNDYARFTLQEIIVKQIEPAETPPAGQALPDTDTDSS
jgi:hypothetical protein